MKLLIFASLIILSIQSSLNGKELTNAELESNRLVVKSSKGIR